MIICEDALSGERLFELCGDDAAAEDFDPDKIFDCGQCFRWNKDADGSWVGVLGGRVLRVRDAAVLSSSIACGSDSPRTGCTHGSAGACHAPTGLVAEHKSSNAKLRHYFDLSRDYASVRKELSGRDTTLKKACESGRGIRILNQEPWETLISFIISQNNNIPRIKKCIEGLCESFGDYIGETEVLSDEGEAQVDEKDIKSETAQRSEAQTDKKSLKSNAPKMRKTKRYHSFPSAERLAKLDVTALAPLHLGYRDKYIIDTARRIAEDGGEGLLSCLDANEKEAFDYLCSLQGVGPKVANCILLFSLEKQESFPIDVWVRRVMNRLYGFDERDTKGMERFARENFAPYGGLAQQYLFYYVRWVGIDK